jgi:hypothetical protein
MEIWEVRDGVVDLLVFKGHYFDFWIGLKRAIVTACSDFYFARYFGIAMDFVAHHLHSTRLHFTDFLTLHTKTISVTSPVLLHKKTTLIHPNFAAKVLMLVSGLETDTEPSSLVSPLESVPVPAMD